MHRFAIAIVGFVVTAVGLALLQTAHTQEKQNTNSTNRSIEVKPAPPQSKPPDDFANATWNIPKDADKTKNPIAATEDSIAKGKEIYNARAGNCVFCHGDTGS